MGIKPCVTCTHSINAAPESSTVVSIQHLARHRWEVRGSEQGVMPISTCVLTLRRAVHCMKLYKDDCERFRRICVCSCATIVHFDAWHLWKSEVLLPNLRFGSTVLPVNFAPYLGIIFSHLPSEIVNEILAVYRELDVWTWKLQRNQIYTAKMDNKSMMVFLLLLLSWCRFLTVTEMAAVYRAVSFHII